MEYMIIEEYGPIALSEKVNKAIAEGWIPQGGVAVVNYPAGDWCYTQAMTRVKP